MGYNGNGYQPKFDSRGKKLKMTIETFGYGDGEMDIKNFHKRGYSSTDLHNLPARRVFDEHDVNELIRYADKNYWPNRLLTIISENPLISAIVFLSVLGGIGSLIENVFTIMFK